MESPETSSRSVSWRQTVPRLPTLICRCGVYISFCLCWQAAEERLGGIDYLVLNHIIYVDLGPWLSTGENITMLEKVMNVNFVAYARLVSSAMKLLQSSNGSIVIISSIAGRYWLTLINRLLLICVIVHCQFASQIYYSPSVLVKVKGATG